jgi:hypothetical protein
VVDYLHKITGDPCSSLNVENAPSGDISSPCPKDKRATKSNKALSSLSSDGFSSSHSEELQNFQRKDDKYSSFPHGDVTEARSSDDVSSSTSGDVKAKSSDVASTQGSDSLTSQGSFDTSMQSGDVPSCRSNDVPSSHGGGDILSPQSSNVPASQSETVLSDKSSVVLLSGNKIGFRLSSKKDVKGAPHSAGDTESLSAGPVVCPLCGKSGLSGRRQLGKHFLSRHGEKQLSGTCRLPYIGAGISDPGPWIRNPELRIRILGCVILNDGSGSRKPIN